MAAVSVCTLKFYLYCKENRKDPPWAWRVRLGSRGLGCALVGSAVAAAGPHTLRIGRPGFYFVQKQNLASPLLPAPDEGRRIFASVSGLWFRIN